jgi:ORF6N domain
MPGKKKNIKSVIADEIIISKIYHMRGQKVMLDRDLAELYNVETRALKQAVKRNIERFPSDFMFSLRLTEINDMVSQNVIPSKSYFGGAKPFVFTEQGVAMLSSILNSDIAIQVNIQIIRIFSKLKELLLTHKDILLKLEKMEKDVQENKKDIAMIFEALKQLLSPPQPKRRLIGFNRKNEE